MARQVKSSRDGRWYYPETEWSYIRSDLCDVLSYFSEKDTNCFLYRQIEFIIDCIDLEHKTD